MARRRSLAEKAHAVAEAERLNDSEEAGKRLGIPGRSIRRWRDDPDLAAIVQKTREETADDVKVAMTLAWERIIQRLKADDIETRDLIVLGGIAFDKFQLATGGATSRSENRDITGSLTDADVLTALRTAQALVGAGDDRTPPEAEGTTEG